MPSMQLADCRQCQRLAEFLDGIKVRYPDYHAAPVSAFGDTAPKLLIVGLAPGMHGANRTGRPFTGDFAGILLYQTLYKFGFANRSESVRFVLHRMTQGNPPVPQPYLLSPDYVQRIGSN